MSPTFSLADSSDSILAVDAGEKHTVSSENSNGSIKSDISLESNSESATEPSSLEPTTSLDVDQDCRAHILAEDPFDSDASRALFDAIDKFQSCGANSEVGTPQLVVVGSQSVGKSSLLQSLTDIPFAVGENCCTRFATRIVSRRTAPGTHNEVKISISPPGFRTKFFESVPEEVYHDFIKVKTSLKLDEFKEIVDEVSTKYLGINPGVGKDKKNFAAEVLKIEVSGPNRSHFSILDIPGIIANDYNVQKHEVENVRDLVIEYMKQPENIVICVADASFDLSNQGIFPLAAENVPKERRIGVFTKCDCTKGSKYVVDVVNGDVSGLGGMQRHEWFVVRNKTDADDEDPNFNLNDTENKLFEQSPWNAISESRRGSTMLKQYLAGLLCEKICAVFPTLFERLNITLKRVRKQRKDLGESRDTHEKRRAHLVDIAQLFQECAIRALKKPWDIEDEVNKVRKIVRGFNATFAKEMQLSGHAYEFEDQSLTEEECLGRLEKALSLNEREDNTVSDTAHAPFQTVNAGILERSASETKPIFAAIRGEVEQCSCTELPGRVHHDVLPRLYKLQRNTWLKLAEEHIGRVSQAVATASANLLKATCEHHGATETLKNEILLTVGEFYNESLTGALRELRRYSDDDLSKILQTDDAGFERKLRLLRTLRMVKSMTDALYTLQGNRGQLSVEKLSDLAYSKYHFSATDNTVLDVHDTLKVYYEVQYHAMAVFQENMTGRRLTLLQVSLKSFVRHVTTCIVENFVTDPQGALLAFSPAFIYSLPDVEVDRLGAEDVETASKRVQLADRIKMLENVQRIGREAMAMAAAKPMMAH